MWILFEVYIEFSPELLEHSPVEITIVVRLFVFLVHYQFLFGFIVSYVYFHVFSCHIFPTKLIKSCEITDRQSFNLYFDLIVYLLKIALKSHFLFLQILKQLWLFLTPIGLQRMFLVISSLLLLKFRNLIFVLFVIVLLFLRLIQFREYFLTVDLLRKLFGLLLLILLRLNLEKYFISREPSVSEIAEHIVEVFLIIVFRDLLDARL